MKKYLIIRFSSFGDIAQCLPAAQAIRQKNPSAEIHWLTRLDFVDTVKSLQSVDKVWGLNRKLGLGGLRQLTRELKQEKFTHIYDAHNNLRSLIASTLLRLKNPFIKYAKRPKSRIKRFLLFCFRINLFHNPFYGAHSFLRPLEKWLGPLEMPEPLNLDIEAKLYNIPPGFIISNAIVIAPSATWELKRWPTEYWSQLVKSLPAKQFIILAGSEDEFCDEIVKHSPNNVLNLRGRVSWEQSTSIISLARAIVSGDTGLLHIADVLGKPAVAIIGPTAFGFPSRKSSLIAEVPLTSRPCTKDGRGKCSNKSFKKCLTDITPDKIKNMIENLPQ